MKNNLKKILFKLKPFLLGLVFIFLMGLTFIHAFGISTNYADASVSDLIIDNEYNLSAILSQQLKVINNNNEPIEVKILVLFPESNNIRKKYSSIPDVKWVSIVPDKYILPPGQKGYSDIMIKIPKNKKLRGKSYQFNIEISATPQKKENNIMFVPSLLSRIMFTIKGKK